MMIMLLLRKCDNMLNVLLFFMAAINANVCSTCFKRNS